MPRRKTVKLNLPVVNPLIKQVFRSNVVFCEKMGRAHNWVTDWNRTDKDGEPKPKNLPSPEEAARMCILLKTTPDEILLRDGETPEETAKCLEDIETVRKLVEAEGIKESTPDSKTEGEDIKVSKAINFVRGASPDEISEIENFFAYLESKRKNNETKS